MPSFLGLYAKTEKVLLDDAGEWWVEVKQCLPKADYDAANRAMGTNELRVSRAGDSRTAFDFTAYQEELVARSIVTWNLTDDAEAILPFTPLEACRASLQLLPQSAFATLYEKINELNSPRGAKDGASFRGGANGRHTAGEDD